MAAGAVVAAEAALVAVVPAAAEAAAPTQRRRDQVMNGWIVQIVLEGTGRRECVPVRRHPVLKLPGVERRQASTEVASCAAMSSFVQQTVPPDSDGDGRSARTGNSRPCLTVVSPVAQDPVARSQAIRP